MNKKVLLPIKFTNAAADRLKKIIINEDNVNLKLRIYITGGGCSGFQYEFMLVEQINSDDFFVEKNGAILVVDHLSLQYLIGSSIDYYEGLEGSHFFVINPNAKLTCSCGSSFSI